MPTLLERQALENDLAFVERQLSEHPDPYDTARLMWEKRREALREEIAAIESQPDALGQVALIFGGNPVFGSREIKLDFAARVLENYQSVVATVAAEGLGVELGSRGPLPGSFESRLFITDMVRGSVGFRIEEEEPVQWDLMPSVLSQAIHETTRILDDLAANEQDRFEGRLRELSPRTLGSIKKLTKVLYDFGAETRIVGSLDDLSLGKEKTASLQLRLTELDVEEREDRRRGKLLGLFPERRQYEFEPADGTVVFYGPVSERLDERYRADPKYAASILLVPSVARFRIVSTIRGGRIEREEWILEEIEVGSGLLPPKA